MPGRIAYVIGFSAPPVLRLHELVDLMIGRGWDCYVTLSPTAASWVDVKVLAETSGHPVRVEPRKPGQADPLPPANAIVAAPVTFNSLNKWAQGNSDTLALGLLNEWLGMRVPITASICAKESLRQHPAYSQSVAALVSVGVHVMEQELIVGSNDGGGGQMMRWGSIAPQ